MGKQMRLEGLWKLRMGCSCDIGAKKCSLWLPTKVEFVMALAPVIRYLSSQCIIPKEVKFITYAQGLLEEIALLHSMTQPLGNYSQYRGAAS